MLRKQLTGNVWTFYEHSLYCFTKISNFIPWIKPALRLIGSSASLFLHIYIVDIIYEVIYEDIYVFVYIVLHIVTEARSSTHHGGIWYWLWCLEMKFFHVFVFSTPKSLDERWFVYHKKISSNHHQLERLSISNIYSLLPFIFQV